MNSKLFKDPIYGYIRIKGELVANVIDTPAFQRLKDIRQTSYTPLYPAAHHNRFVHSLGVYHLGQLAINSIDNDLVKFGKESDIGDELDNVKRIFGLACLLHDIGHAPFSHTGEQFYIDEEGTLYKELCECVGTREFKADFKELGTKKPAAHECMSCIVGLRIFGDLIGTDFERELFARCIIGMPIRFTEKMPDYTEKMSEEERNLTKAARTTYKGKKKSVELLNCIISLLNSSIIDVDRLDYIIRDAVTIGFKSVQVDYLRLLSGIRIVAYNNKLCIGYHKSALSVIESAVYAHDAEKKWIQNHPSILYEMEVLKSAMNELTSKFSSAEDPNPLFCYQSLTEEGKTLKISEPLFSTQAYALAKGNQIWAKEAQDLSNNGKIFANKSIDSENYLIIKEFPISLLADEDFLYLMKQFCKESLGYEYFARNKRRVAAWKSEAEFRALFQLRIGDESQAIIALEQGLGTLIDYCQKKTGLPIVNEKIFSILDKEERDTNESKSKKEFDDDFYEDILDGIKEKRKWAIGLQEISKKIGIEFDYLIISQKKFSSSFKESLKSILIYFPGIENEVVPMGEVLDVLGTDSTKKSNFFHLFFVANDAIGPDDKKKIVSEIAKALNSLAST